MAVNTVCRTGKRISASLAVIAIRDSSLVVESPSRAIMALDVASQAKFSFWTIPAAAGSFFSCMTFRRGSILPLRAFVARLTFYGERLRLKFPLRAVVAGIVPGLRLEIAAQQTVQTTSRHTALSTKLSRLHKQMGAPCRDNCLPWRADRATCLACTGLPLSYGAVSALIEATLPCVLPVHAGFTARLILG